MAIRQVAGRAAYAGSIVPGQETGSIDRQLELVALLESAGINDQAALEMGAEDVFDLAPRLLSRPLGLAPGIRRQHLKTIQQVMARTLAQRQPIQRQPFAVTVEHFLRTLLHGPLTLWSMMIMLVALGDYEGMFQRAGVPTWLTILSLGVGMVLVGAMIQGLAWRTSIALSQKNAGALRAVLKVGLAAGIGCGLVASGLLAAGGVFFELPPLSVFSLGASCFLLVVLMLLVGNLALLDQGLLAGVSLTVAFAASLLGQGFFAIDPVVNFVFGYCIALASLVFFFWISLRWVDRQFPSQSIHNLPPAGQLLYKATPYLCYGGLAVLYVFLSQVVGYLGQAAFGWTTDEIAGALTAAHVLGLVSMVLTQGVTEVAVRAFWPTLQRAQYVALGDFQTLHRLVWSFLEGHFRRLAIAQSVLAMVLGAAALVVWPRLGLEGAVGILVPMMMAFCLIGYGLLALGLFGCSFLITMAQPWPAVRALLTAGLAGLGVGLILGQFGGFEMATFGMVAGGTLLVLSTLRSLRRLLLQVDYVLYQAF